MSGKTLTDDVKNRSAWTFFMGVVTAALGVFLIVYPLMTATITTLLLGWVMIFVGIAQFVFALHSQTVRIVIVSKVRRGASSIENPVRAA